MNIDHSYAVTVTWEGNRGTGTSDYKSYGRSNSIVAEGKHPIAGSADRPFRGDADRWNPEELLLASLSECHMLSYLHVAASHGIVVTDYTDAAVGSMRQTSNGGGHFTSVTLRPVVTIESGDSALALALHDEAEEKCFIAASMNFPVRHEPTTLTR
ncbi:OsmC family protein [Glaciihabitans sp. dw_435]|uniref:OsmC family protein n=1 Tax=Glaciihabitans sp. dw_435 TaxID=2720081 RepID=UPI001BD4764D|nr:OsmC family protein [Glaciihabitans sp. dw_435]